MTKHNETADKRLFGVAQRCQNEKVTGEARNGETERFVQSWFIG